MADGKRIQLAVRGVTKRFTVGDDEIEALALAADISFSPVARPQDLFDHPHLLANGSLAPTTLPGGGAGPR